MSKQDNVEETDSLNELSMNILIHAGNARNDLVDALNYLEDFEFSKADESIQAAKKEIVIAHGLQTDTLQLEASGNQIRYSTLFCHAQDTLMTAKSEILIGEHILRLFKKMNEQMKK
ncbi:PTS lactose/cellobiose transporter subunit IIA [Listeria ivanovii]|uniref:PTS lactose/cellobiose transporter subunit IIA n=2 Tax=Listeria ivanovii TaxID=1638 RepID=A0ABS1G1Q7_LISIV|nr:PTS lactose/cellobiose transporter subunit IIA [Listeria ivanovii]EFR97543.1 PTS system, beta-glucoside-specific, IIA component [Listeria ivanovii FSL F6-596]AIS59338.1 PTS lactose transporter subunit IIA [Listeria ivanovii subsp. londoniensis]AIS62170.1 PTS lactose transporter subunit IIA [Listeria ivanovii subsp. londoniensis]MBC2255648.1 PTS lactose/cellobiose transporter subunit IIA [Listeria ivanovii]MBK1960798.1 PTS lactose/cellobiose transporter subunit IIA [Listeria ivanovii subsp. 